MVIAFQISQLISEISNLNQTIQDNNEKIRRLEVSNTKIIGDQNELSMQKNHVNRPELSIETWNGKHANEFLDKRGNIKNEYNQMMNSQVEVLLDNIGHAIKQLNNANSNLSDSIESNRYRICNLREMEDD